MRTLILCIAFLASTNIFAKDLIVINPKTGTIYGKVIHDTNLTPISDVDILIKDLSDNIIKVGNTKPDGKFQINKIPEGKYYVIIKMAGYKEYVKKIYIINKRKKIYFGNVKLKQEPLIS